MSKGTGYIQKRILLLLQAGIAMSFAYTPGQRRRITRRFEKELDQINKSYLYRAIDGLYKNKLIDFQESADGIIKITMSENGKKKTLSYKLDELKISKPNRWDKKWRIVIFDIPEKIRRIRNTIRSHLKKLGFYELQKSVFVIPYDCKNELDFLIEFYQIRKYVRQILASAIDNELHLKNIFEIL